MTDEKTPQEKGFESQPQHEFVPGLDELAFRLQVEPQEPPFSGIVLFGKSGKAFSLTQILSHHMQFVLEGVELTSQLLEKVQKEAKKSEPDKRSGQSKKANNTARDSKSNKS